MAPVSGSDLVNTVRTTQDLVDIGVEREAASALFAHITEWNAHGLPSSFSLVPGPVTIGAERNHLPTISVYNAAATHKAFCSAKYCGSKSDRHTLKQQADAGNLYASAYLGLLYCDTDRTKAADYAQKALPFLHSEIDHDSPHAAYIRGFLCETGLCRGVVKNTQEAERFYELAAAQGLATAQSALNALAKTCTRTAAGESTSPARTPPQLQGSTAITTSLLVKRKITGGSAVPVPIPVPVQTPAPAPTEPPAPIIPALAPHSAFGMFTRDQKTEAQRMLGAYGSVS